MAAVPPKWKLRKSAAVLLHNHGWPASHIARVLGWKEVTVPRMVSPAPTYTVEDRRLYDLGFELSIRAQNKLALLKPKSVVEVRDRIDEFAALPGVGAKTVAEVSSEVERLLNQES